MWFLNLSEPQPSLLLALNIKHMCRMHLSKSKHTGPVSLTEPHKFSPEGSYQTTGRRHKQWCTDKSSFYLVCTKVDPSLLWRKWLSFPHPSAMGYAARLRWCLQVTLPLGTISIMVLPFSSTALLEAPPLLLKDITKRWNFSHRQLSTHPPPHQYPTVWHCSTSFLHIASSSQIIEESLMCYPTI